MEKFQVKKEHLVGRIADFPLHVVQLMVDEQVRQGNKADPSVFARLEDAGKDEGGFDWVESRGCFAFWSRVIGYKQFNLIPKPTKPKGHVHAKLMKQYAKDAKVSETPWEKWECRNSDVSEDWYALEDHPIWSALVEYRRKDDNQVESKEPPTPNEIIRAMLDKGMVVWAGVSENSYDEARGRLGRCIFHVVEYTDGKDFSVRTHNSDWSYAVPIDTTTMTEITELP